jgi:hypothetical protein
MLIWLPPFSNQDNDKATQSLSSNISEIKEATNFLTSRSGSITGIKIASK